MRLDFTHSILLPIAQAMAFQYSLFDTLLEPVFIVDDKQKIIYCNEPASILVGLSARRLTRGVRFDEVLSFSEPIDWLADVSAITDSTPYKEVNFKSTESTEGKIQITAQPIQCERAEKAWIIFFRDVTLEERLQMKYRGELEQKESIILDLKKAREALEDYSKNLEKKVEERTVQISEMNRTMSALLDSLAQGFFIFDESGRCLNVHSKACLSTVECAPDGKYLWEVLKLPADKIPGIQKWIKTIFMDLLPLEDLIPLGPPEYNHSEGKKISIEYCPMMGAGAQIEGVVVVATDITSLFAAKKLAEQEKARASMIINLIQHRLTIGRTLRECRDQLKNIEIELKNPTPNEEILFRSFHTLKGTAGILSAEDLRDACHKAEDKLAEYKKDTSELSMKTIVSANSEVQKSYQGFLDQVIEVLGTNSISEKRILEIPAEEIEKLLNQLENSQSSHPGNFLENSRQIFERLREFFLLEPIGNFFKNYQDYCLDLGKELGKNIRRPQFINPSIPILPDPYIPLFSSLVHAFRNSLDHGIETETERVDKGKESFGSIKVQFSLKRNSSDELRLYIQIKDDGRGIDPNLIRFKLSEKKVDTTRLSDFEVIQHIFDSGLSTKQQVTSVSGRGIGMDAIRTAAKDLGGNAWIESILGVGTTLYIEAPYITSKNTVSVLETKAS